MTIAILLHPVAVHRFSARYLVLVLPAILAACVTQLPAPATSPPSVSSRHAAVQSPAAPTAAAPAIPPVLPQVEAPPVREAPLASVDKAAVLQTWVDQQDRLYRVAAPLLVSNTELCRHHARNLLGLTAKTKYSYSGDFVAEAQSMLGLGERLHVMNVLPGGGAALAGISKGDILVAVEIEPLPQGPDAESIAAHLISSEMQGRSNLALTILHDGERMTMHVPLMPACAMTIDVGNTVNVNSYADGDRIMVTVGMLRFVQSDEELAYVLAKEMAHNVLAPSVRMDIGAVIDRLHTLNIRATDDDLAAGLTPYSPVLDATADKLALYMLVRAGYDIDNALDFWKRLAIAYPAEIRAGHTALHPSTSYRFSVISQIIDMIKMKQKNNLPLAP